MITKNDITERIIELNYELLNAIRVDDNHEISKIKIEINNLIKLYLKCNVKKSCSI